MSERKPKVIEVYKPTVRDLCDTAYQPLPKPYEPVDEALQSARFETPRSPATRAGIKIARVVFSRRERDGRRNAEVHLSENELALVCAAAYQLGMEGRTGARDHA